MRTRAALAAVALLAGASLAIAQEPLKIFGLTIPERVDGLPRGPLYNYEKTNPGLGYSVRFKKTGWLIDVYLYDLRLTQISDDPNSEIVRRQLGQATGDIRELERRGNYANVRELGSYAIKDRDGRTRFICSAFTYLHKQIGAVVDSYLCLTSWNNKFFKIRMTAQQSESSRQDAVSFVEAWIGVLWPS
jgi:hypothetical protein